jgi:hypothetical protein
MSNPGIGKDEVKRRWSAYHKYRESERAAAKALGIERSSLSLTLKRYPDPTGGLEFPDFPVADLPIDHIINTMAERSKLRKTSYEAHTWFPVKVNDKKPIGVMFFGDPHVDDDGCDWTLLKRDVAICQHPGIYAVNIGDSTNNWAGRLIKKYADQETSAKTAARLAEWLMLDAGIKWMIFLLGNHDQWNDGAAILSQMAKRHGTQKLVLHDWEARFSLNFPNGTKVKVWTAHDFPGDSQWNPLHGPVKAARFGPDVDLLVCGHKHHWGVSQWELADKGTTPLMIRVRGYKFNDDYARRIGKTEQKGGSSILAIIDPNATTAEGRMMAFADVEKGADYLKFLRGPT